MKRQLALKLFAIKGIISNPYVYFAGFPASHLYCLLFTLFHGIRYIYGASSPTIWVVVFKREDEETIWLAQKPVYEEEVGS